MNYGQLLGGMVLGYLLRPHIQKMMSKDESAMGALHMNPAHMGALAMQQNPLHMGAIHTNPAHMGAIELSGMHY